MNYNLVYVINGKVRETLRYNVARPLGQWLLNQARDSGNYRYGLLQLRRI
jgi:hypothetical protein